jgi:hypothetical protein
VRGVEFPGETGFLADSAEAGADPVGEVGGATEAVFDEDAAFGGEA